MRHRFLAAILIAFLAVPLQAQQALDEFFGEKPTGPAYPDALNRAPGAPSEWTVIVYIAADNNLDPQAIGDIQEMEKVGSTDQVKITVLLDRGQGWKTARRALIQRAPEEDVQSMNPNLPTCEELGEIDSGSVNALRDFVVWSQRNFPSRRSTLILWNHGGGWRSLDCLETEPESGVRSLTRSPVQTREICSDDTSNSVMYMKDVRQCLEGIGTTFDLICFDACLMGMLEVLYEMKDLAPYVVASEQTIPGQGYDYTPFLDALVRNPGMDGRSLGMKIVDSYGRSDATAKDVTLSLADSRAVGPLVQSLDDLVRQTGGGREAPLATGASLNAQTSPGRAAGDNLPAAFRMARRDANPPMGAADDPTAFYDLGTFLVSLAQSGNSSPGIRQAAQTTVQAYNQTILRNFNTLGRSRTGMAIFFPESTAAAEFQNYTETNILFARDSLWPAFIRAYAEGGGIPPGPGPQPPAPPPTGPISTGPKALIVGVGDYATLPDLRWPSNDTAAYAQLVTSHGYSPDSILVLRDGQATKEAIRNALINMATSARPGEVLFFAFGGHGAQVTDLDRDEYDRKDEALCPFDARLEDPGSLLLDDDLRAAIDLNRNAFWVLFLGCSHSGEGSRNLDMEFTLDESNTEGETRSGELDAFFGEGASSVEPAGGAEVIPEASEETRAGGFFDSEGGAGSKDLNRRVAVFSACKSFQIAWGEERSMFVEHLLNGHARGALVPGLSTYGDVSKHLNRRLALMNVYGRIVMIAGVPPLGARQIEIGGIPVRQDPNTEVPIPMKNIPFLGRVQPRDIGLEEFEARSVPDPIEISR